MKYIKINIETTMKNVTLNVWHKLVYSNQLNQMLNHHNGLKTMKVKLTWLLLLLKRIEIIIIIFFFF